MKGEQLNNRRKLLVFHRFINKIQAEKSNLRAKALRRQLDELEEEMTRERTKSRNLARQIDDLNEAIDTITRENTNLRLVRTKLSLPFTFLRGGAARRNRENMRLRSYQIPGSSENLTKNEADDDSIGTEGNSKCSDLLFTRLTESGSLHIDDKKSVVQMQFNNAL